MAPTAKTDAEIARLNTEISLVRVIAAAGIKLAGQGGEMTGACPFHADEAASLTVNQETNRFRCAACNAGGGVIEWVMKKNGVSLRHAVELLKEGRGDVTEKPVKRSAMRALQAPVNSAMEDKALLNQVIDYYHHCLKSSPEALEYLKARGIHNPELIDTFRLGYANRTLGLRLPKKQWKEGALVRKRLEEVGLYRASGHEHFNGALVVPIMDARGDVCGAYGRKIRSDLRAGTALHLHLSGPERGIWNRQALAASKEIILCRSLIDAMTFWCAGYRNVTAAHGPDGLTGAMLDGFRSHGMERVLIAYGNDDAGGQGAESDAARLMDAGLECWRIRFPQGKDANAYALNTASATDSLGQSIRKAEWLGKGQAPARKTPEPDVSFLPPELPAEPACRRTLPWAFSR